MPLRAVVALCVLLWAPAARADSGLLGTGTPALGRGGAFTADADDPTAIRWNPAGAVQARENKITLAFGMLPRPDRSEGGFGFTEGYFLGGLWAPGRGRDDKPYAFLLAVAKDNPRLEYRATRLVVDPFGTTQVLTVSLTRDAQDILGGASYVLARGPALGGKWKLSAGITAGVTFSDESWKGTVTTGGGVPPFARDENRSLSLRFPLGMGVIFSSKWGTSWGLSFGAAYRTRKHLSHSRLLRFPDLSFDLRTPEISGLSPSDEFHLAVQFSAASKLKASAEARWLWAVPPSIFPRAFPRREFGVRCGVELSLPLRSFLDRVALRGGVSRNFVFTHLPDSPAACDVNGFYGGFGASIVKRIDFDFFASFQVPSPSRVDAYFV
ncbi:MAG: hypothetical protein ACYS47_21600, partial [Planctomycetota bacterium]